MDGLLDVVFDIEFALILDIITAFMFGFLLFLIKVPNTAYSRKIAQTKNTIAVCFIVCAILFYWCFRYSGMKEDYEVFSSMMMFVVTAISSAILSFSLINLLDEKYIENDKFYLNVGIVAILSVIFMKSFWWENGWAKNTVIIVAILLFIIQCVSHIFSFRRIYRQSLQKMEQYYDEEEDQKLKWVKFCYVITMLTQMFILVYMLLPRGFMKVYNVWYSLYILYFTANFISFIGSHKLMLDAFAYKTLSGQDIISRRTRSRMKLKDLEGAEKDTEQLYNENEYKKLEKSLEKWVEKKLYTEYDKSRDDVAKELKTTREFLHLYFTTRVGMDFKTWRTSLRVDEAKRLLLEKENVSINIVGEMAGFSDRSNFHRQFVKIVGCSPRQWRESKGKVR